MMLMFYRHGPETGEWGSTHLSYDLVTVTRHVNEKTEIMNGDYRQYVNSKNLYSKEDLTSIEVELPFQKECINVIVGSAYRKKTELGVMAVYGVSIDDGRLYQLRLFSAKGFMKAAKSYMDGINGFELIDVENSSKAPKI